MRCFDLEIYANALKTKEDLEKYILDLLKPLENRFIRQDTRLHIRNTSTGSSDQISQMEGFSRIIWGLVALDNMDANQLWWEKIRAGLIHGTTPGHQDYYGDVDDFDQRIVEMAAIGYAFVLKPEFIYMPLSENEKHNVYQWLNQINEREAYPCNWKFFRVMVNIGFKQLGLEYNQEKMEVYLKELDMYYLGKGWYRDGDLDQAHADYYVPFAMHYYGLFYSKYMKDVDPIRAQRYQERAVEFSKEFIYWFSEDGAALPYGRSLAYRYAQVAFWSMMVVTDTLGPFTLGEIKGLILRHLRWWNQKPIYDAQGMLTMGYTYEQPYMSEEYIASGSVYWSLKALVIGVLPKNHPFWQTQEAPFPSINSVQVQNGPRLVLWRQQGEKQVLAYNGGNYHTNGHIHVECKYEKFVYSTLFGFSVPRSHRRLEFGAYDSILAVSLDGVIYQHKEKSDAIEIDQERIKIEWKPFSGVNIVTYLIMGFPWHIRVHRIETQKKLYTAEGGFAIGLETLNDRTYLYETYVNQSQASCVTEVAYSHIENVLGEQKPYLIKASSNTNIMNSRTLIPTLKTELSKGVHWIASFVAGDEGKKKIEKNMLPEIKQMGDQIQVLCAGGKKYVLKA